MAVMELDGFDIGDRTGREHHLVRAGVVAVQVEDIEPLAAVDAIRRLEGIGHADRVVIAAAGYVIDGAGSRVGQEFILFVPVSAEASTVTT